MPNSVFVDTHGWLALLHSKDVIHQRANEVWRDIGLRGCDVVVTDWVIAETGNGLARTRIRHLFADAAERICTSSKVEVVMVDRGLMATAVDFYRRHTDKSWGLVDCASFRDAGAGHHRSVHQRPRFRAGWISVLAERVNGVWPRLRHEKALAEPVAPRLAPA
jgi:uncharacterized protein